MLQLRCATFDAKIVDGTFSEYDAKVFLAFSNSLTRTMSALGLEGKNRRLCPHAGRPAPRGAARGRRVTAFQNAYANERLAAEVARTAPRRRRLAATAAHAAAAQELDRLWHELSRGMFPPLVPHHDEAHAALVDCGDDNLTIAAAALRAITGRSGRRH